MRPAGPTNGRPWMSSWSPGCSPTSMISARSLPSPKTVWVPFSARSHARQPAPACVEELEQMGSDTWGRQHVELTTHDHNRPTVLLGDPDLELGTHPHDAYPLVAPAMHRLGS